MKRDNWSVGDYGIRPAGDPKKCFYCGEQKGGTHKAGCVIRQRTVVLEMKTFKVVQVPEDWNTDQIESYYENSEHCRSAVMLREATPQDEGLCDVFVADCES